MQQATKKRFIAGAICPECGAQDAIRLVIQGDRESVECVKCDYREQKPLASDVRAGESVIGVFKPTP